MNSRAAVGALRITNIPADCTAVQRIVYRHITAQLDIARRQLTGCNAVSRQITNRKIVKIQSTAVDSIRREIASHMERVDCKSGDCCVCYIQACCLDCTGNARPSA